MKKIVIVASRLWNPAMLDSLCRITKVDAVLVQAREDLTFERLNEIRPEYIFFPHWSYMIPAELYENYDCIMFHMTDLPFGRGGSPLQNLIVRGIYDTKITAFKCTKEVDAGPVYLKKPLSLHGSAQEIFIRASGIIEDMILEIIEKKIEPVPQEGKVVCFERRNPSQSEVPSGIDLVKFFDYIRMLDAEGYPSAFIKAGNFKVEFSGAQLKDGYIVARARIIKQEGVADG